MTRLWITLRHDESGQDLVEYALMASFCAIAAGAFFPPALTGLVRDIFSKVISGLTVANSV